MSCGVFEMNLEVGFYFNRKFADFFERNLLILEFLYLYH